MLGQRFKFDASGLTVKWAYNVAPTQKVLTVVGGDTRQGMLMRWGLIPHWARDTSLGSRMYNARTETVAEKPAFRDALRKKRCLVLADGFYEWQRTGAAKRPMRAVMRSGEPFAFAGLWSTWRGLNGDRISSCSIITTVANDLLRPIHDRMPVILPKDLEEFWLDVSIEDSNALTSVLAPYPAHAMEMYEVSTLVNSTSNDGPEVIARAT